MVFVSKVLTTKDAEWNEIIDSVPSADAYYSAGYHNVYERSYFEEIDDAFGGEAFLFFYGDETSCVIFPFMKRRIKSPYISGEYYDLGTVYGYSGPIINCSDEDKRGELIDGFIKSLTEYCVKNNIVSGFIRFHPLLDNYLDFQEYVKLIDEKDTIYIDLTKDVDFLLMDMKKKTRNQVRKAQKSEVEVYRSEDVDDLKAFVNLYLGRMEYIGTGKKFFFPFEFYKNTKDFLEKDSSLFIAKYKGNVIGGSFFIHRNDFAHYHFSGSDKDFWTLSPANLILWEAIKYFKEKGYKKLHLGAGNSPGDSLYHFKYGFSKSRSIFRGAGIVFNQDLYEKFVGLRKDYCLKNGLDFNDKYFPAYLEFASAGDYDREKRLPVS